MGRSRKEKKKRKLVFLSCKTFFSNSYLIIIGLQVLQYKKRNVHSQRMTYQNSLQEQHDKLYMELIINIISVSDKPTDTKFIL